MHEGEFNTGDEADLPDGKFTLPEGGGNILETGKSVVEITLQKLTADGRVRIGVRQLSGSEPVDVRRKEGKE
jgi:hypothetical protein